MTMHKALHPRDGIDRLYVSRKKKRKLIKQCRKIHKQVDAANYHKKKHRAWHNWEGKVIHCEIKLKFDYTV